MMEVYISFLIYWISLSLLFIYATRRPKEESRDEERI